MLIDIAGILAAVDRTWEEMGELIADANTQAIESKIYGWGNSTMRSNGEIVTSPRDIVDTGALKDSQSCTKSGDTWHLNWGVNYAAEVHEGIGNKPARKWTQVAITGDATADPDYQNPNAILNVPTAFTERFNANYQRQGSS